MYICLIYRGDFESLCMSVSQLPILYQSTPNNNHLLPPDREQPFFCNEQAFLTWSNDKIIPEKGVLKVFEGGNKAKLL